MVRGRVICQHSSTEALLTAEMAVKLKDVIGVIALAMLMTWFQAATFERVNDSVVSSGTEIILSSVPWSKIYRWSKLWA